MSREGPSSGPDDAAPTVAVTAARIEAGHATYRPAVLRVYDWVALGLNSRFFWRCPAKYLQAHFDRHVSDNHLDVGVGSGYFLDRTTFRSDTPRIVLMDLNRNALDHAARRIARYRPRTIVHDALQPYRQELAPFDSISINYLLHCVPGNLLQKAVILENLSALLNPGGVLLGTTILRHGVSVPICGRPMLWWLSRTGVFNNEADRLVDLKAMLARHFPRWELNVRGMVALFAAWRAAS
jgi:SAM-dependent methyltransferase